MVRFLLHDRSLRKEEEDDDDKLTKRLFSKKSYISGAPCIKGTTREQA
jgi:hypothetical protein